MLWHFNLHYVNDQKLQELLDMHQKLSNTEHTTGRT